MTFIADAAKVLTETLATGAPRRVRQPVVWQSQMRADRNEPALLMRINPQQVQFQQGKRIQKQDTVSGSTYFHFSNTRGQNNDILTLQLSGTTGNIDPRAIQRHIGKTSLADFSTDKTGALDNLRAWVSFYQLTLEPIVDLSTGRPNLVTMQYASSLFPKPISFIGFFGSVLQFTEMASEPFQRQWSVPFIVNRTEPALDTIVRYLAEQVADTSTLDRLRSAFNLV